LRPDDIQLHYHATFSAAALTLDSAAVLGKLRAMCEAAERVFLDVDCDVFDPAYFPAVAQPRPLGLAPHFLVQLLDSIGSDRLTGFAISEFDPARDVNDRCLETLMWLIEYVLLAKYEK
jgi:arginase family enzyme